MKNKLILWLVLLVVGFLGGFIPEFIKAQRLSDEVAATKQQLASCQADNQLSQVRALAALMYLETTRKNYGTAGEYAGRFFALVQQAANQNTNPTVRNTLDEVLKSRDSITAALAKGDPAVVGELQPLVVKVEQGTQPAQ